MGESPFEGVFGGAGDIPVVFKAQFLYGAEDRHRVVLNGVMRQVWVRHRWMQPMVWLLSRFGLLIGKSGENVPVRLEISAYCDEAGRAHHEYRRTLTFDTTERFDTDAYYVPGLDRAVEVFGVGRLLFIVWDAEYQSPNRLMLNAKRFGARIFGWHLALPESVSWWTIGRAEFVQTALDGESTSIDLVIKHPLLKELFGYEGIFNVSVEPN